MITTSKVLESFVKGRIVELLFEMMIREDQNHTFTIIPFGYERMTPELAQYQDLIRNSETLKVIRRSPDFILIKNDKTEIHFVEVKYRKQLSLRTKSDLTIAVKDLKQYWPDTWVFLATQNGFYFDSGDNIVQNKGQMASLDNKIILPEIQSKYLGVLKSFIRVEEMI